MNGLMVSLRQSLAGADFALLANAAVSTLVLFATASVLLFGGLVASGVVQVG